MIRAELLREDGIVIVTPEGPLQAADFAQLAGTVDPFIEERGGLAGLMIHAQAFPGWADFAALLSHLRFVRDHHHRIARIAAVTDAGFMSILPSVAKHFVQAEIRHFDYANRAAALAWLRGQAG